MIYLSVMSQSNMNISTIEGFKTQVTRWYQNESTLEEIRVLLFDCHQITISARTLKRRLRDWGVSKNTQILPEIRGILKLRIAFHYYRNLSDEEIKWALTHEGFQSIPIHTIARLRLDMKLMRKTSVKERDAAQETLRKQVQTELDKGTIENYGRGALHVHFRKIGISVAR
jgi:hypothetical protein